MAKHNEVGIVGEGIARKWLLQKGFEIVEQNYRKKWGEIDIIARSFYENMSRIHFIEVKTVSHETREDLDIAVSYGTWRPEEKVDRKKKDRMRRVIQTWLLEKKYTDLWQIDILSIRVVPHEKYARIVLIDNVILE